MSGDQGVEPRGSKVFVLENWEVIRLPDRKGALKLCLAGLAFGGAHPLAGAIVRTSAIARYRMQGNRLVILTQSGSEYMLGMRDAPQEEDRRRLIRYLEQISSIGDKEILESASDSQTDILGTQGGGAWRDGADFAA